MPDLLESPPTPTDAPRSESPVLADFDKTFSDDLAPSPAPTPNEPPPETTRTTPPKDPATGQFTKTAEKPVPVPAKGPETTPDGTKEVVKEASKTIPQSSEFEPPQIAKPSELRSYAKKMAGRAQQAEQQISQLRSELGQLKSQPQQSDPRIMEELASAKKRIADYEGELKVTRYERSQEYKDKFEVPYQNAVRNAYDEVKELLVSVPNPSDPDNPQERQATPQDFDEVYQLPLGAATKLAKAKFGDAASIVIQHVKAIKDASRAAIGAVQSHKGQAEQYEQQTVAQQKLIEEGRNRMFTEALQGISEKFPDLFDVKDGDSDWNSALEKGRGMADLAFGDRSRLTPAQSTILDAHIFSRVSSYPAILNAYRKSASKIEALEKEITELRGSAPGKTTPSAPKADTGFEGMSIDQAFDKAIPE